MGESGDCTGQAQALTAAGESLVHFRAMQRQVRMLFDEALNLPPEVDRSEWLRARSNGDDALWGEVVSLLSAHAQMQRSTMGAAAEPTRSERVFGAWRTIRLIGRGGTSAVYLAERADGQFDQKVALKILASWLASADFLRRFKTERQLLAALNHNNITRLLDGGMSPGGDPFLITEYVDGRTIERYCDEQRLDIRRRIRLFLQVCEAVDYAHRNLIVHRDLKPANILVNEEGTVKLLDFGTAALLEGVTDVTATRARMATPRYASPEQLRGERLTVATDVYSLGVILYELLTGAWPFGDPDSVVSELNRVLGEAAVSPLAAGITAQAAAHRSASLQNLRMGVRGDLSFIVLKALEGEPSRRYHSVRELAADLDRFLEGHPVHARRQTVFYRARRFVRRRWVAVTVAVVFVLGLGLSTIVAIRQAQVAQVEAHKALEEARKSARVTTFLRDMMTRASNAGGANVTVSQMLVSAEPSIEQSWKNDPLGEATLRSSLGAIWVNLQQPDRAARHLKRALTLFQSLGRHVDAADTLLVLAINQQGSRQSTECYRRSLRELQLAGREAPPALVFRVKTYLAGAVKSYDPAEALRLTNEALTLAAGKTPIPADQLAAAYEIRGEATLESGHFGEVEANCRKAIEIDSHAFDAWATLARVRSMKGDSAGAAAFAQRDFEQANGYGIEDKAEAQIWWARYRSELHQGAAALSQVREALPEVRKFWILGQVSANYDELAARVYNNVGRFAEAEECARRSLDGLTSDEIPERHFLRAAALEDLGYALYGKGQRAEGVAALAKSAEIYGDLGPAFSILTAEAKARLSRAKQSRSSN